MCVAVVLIASQSDVVGVEILFRPHLRPRRVCFAQCLGYIESFEYIDRLLSRSIRCRIQPILTLEDIEAGSILTWLKNMLETVDDEALKSGDVKKLIGAYLVTGKKILIDYCNKRTTIGSRAEIEELQRRTARCSWQTDVIRIPMYSPPPQLELRRSLRMIAGSTESLRTAMLCDIAAPG